MAVVSVVIEPTLDETVGGTLSVAPEVDQRRRHFLTQVAVGFGAVGAGFAAVPFIASWQPSARAKALGAPVTVDVSKLQPGQMLKVVYRGQPVVIVRRTQATLLELGKHDHLLADPKSENSQQPPYIKESGPARARHPEYWVGFAVCTHLGCSPLGAFEPNEATQLAGINLGANWPGGFYCPCHGSKFDISGRVFKGVPAPTNLKIPPYAFNGDNRILIGEDQATANA